jgi:LruC domain-containing protein
MKKTLWRLLAIAVVIPALTTCMQPVSSDYDFASAPESTMQTSARTGAFAFETMFPLELTVDVTLYDDGGTPAETGGPAIVTVRNPAGAVVFEGATNAGESVTVDVSVVAAWEHVSVEVTAAGWQTQTFRIDDPGSVSAAAIEAHLTPGGLTTQKAGTEDFDGDGIPDVYDADPTTADTAFTFDVPADGTITVAYEDNFPQVGDGDYNDFVATYETLVYTGTDSADPDGGATRVTGLAIDVDARARVAGYDHEFGFVIKMPGLQGILTVTVTDPVSGAQEQPMRNALVEDPDGTGVRIPVFSSTKQAFTKTGPSPGGVDNGYPDYLNSVGHHVQVEIYQIRAIDRFNPPDPWYVEMPPFDPYLYIHNTDYDVHLIDKPELDPTNNPPETFDWGFRDPAGYPRALLVPTDWGHPRETLHIEEAYPDFQAWRESEGEEATDWYLNPNPDQVVYPPSP